MKDEGKPLRASASVEGKAPRRVAFLIVALIENRTGAAGNIGAELAAKSPPDGYTLFQMSMTHAVNATLYTSLPYDKLEIEKLAKIVKQVGVTSVN